MRCGPAHAPLCAMEPSASLSGPRKVRTLNLQQIREWLEVVQGTQASQRTLAAVVLSPACRPRASPAPAGCAQIPDLPTDLPGRQEELCMCPWPGSQPQGARQQIEGGRASSRRQPRAAGQASAALPWTCTSPGSTTHSTRGEGQHGADPRVPAKCGALRRAGTHTANRPAQRAGGPPNCRIAPTHLKYP
jgi:hypothetical protein